MSNPRTELLLLVACSILLGLLTGIILGWATKDGPAQCQEDEVAMWPMEKGQWTGYENTECVPYDQI